jgi:ribosome biogenesis GTPase A
MAKTKRLLEENIKLVDVVLELRDARAPVSSANPLLGEVLSGRPRVLVLNKTDLADPRAVEKFIKASGDPAYAVDAHKPRDVAAVVRAAEELGRPRVKVYMGKPLRPVRALVAGIPNVGKSTLLNTLAGKAKAKTGAKPGVTKDKQWLHYSSTFEILDTPGILWPKFDDPNVAVKLVAIDAVGTGGFEAESAAIQIYALLADLYPAMISERYGFSELPPPPEFLPGLAHRRGYVLGGQEPDTRRAAEAFIMDVQRGKLGKLCLDSVTFPA